MTVTFDMPRSVDRWDERLEAEFDCPPPKFPKRRFPAAPLLARFGNSELALAHAANVHERTVERWLTKGLRYRDADIYCTRAGETPSHVWLDWHLSDDEYAEQQAARQEAEAATVAA